VLERFYLAAKQYNPEYVMRLTSDCPLIDPVLVDDLISKFLESGADYASNSLNSTLPDGMDAEIFKFRALEEAFNSASLKSEREHVTPYIRNSGKFNVLAVDYSPSLGNIRLTLDTIEDYNLINSLIEQKGENASMQSYVDTVINNPELKKLNSNTIRNEGYLKSLKEDKDVKSNN
jgi:spore coat polysaccharide biosynthesis protein SpsF (cytidylyltransferase family)